MQNWNMAHTKTGSHRNIEVEVALAGHPHHGSEGIGLPNSVDGRHSIEA